MVAVSANGPEIADFKNEEQVRHRAIPLSRKITPFQDLYCIYKLYRLIREERPHIVHSHTPKAGLIGMISAYLARVPIRLHTVAGLPLMETNGVKRKVLVLVEKMVYSFATKIYPNSFAMKAFIENDFYSRPDKMKVIGNGSSNGINTDFFNKSDDLQALAIKIRNELGITPHDKVAVFVGRVTGDKGINELVKGMKDIPSLKLLLVGPMEEDLDPLDKLVVEEIHNNDNIKWVGFQNDVRPYLIASDFLVFPSYREGFPNVPMQAGALGLPCIVTDINGCNEIIDDEVNGLIIPSKDKEALVEAILRLLNDQGLYEGMKAKARGMIEQRYAQGVIWNALEEEYSKLYNQYV